jgi:hypothetical protein
MNRAPVNSTIDPPTLSLPRLPEKMVVYDLVEDCARERTIKGYAVRAIEYPPPDGLEYSLEVRPGLWLIAAVEPER